MKPELRFFIYLSKIQAILSRKFDARLGGLSFSEFIILYHLSQAPEEKLRGTDLAEKIGLTASGVTRLLGPMAKIGLVRREVDQRDARVSYVVLAPGGKRKFDEALKDGELLSAEIISSSKIGPVKDFCQGLKNIAKVI